jgi:preprotein translocase subunit SecE
VTDLQSAPQAAGAGRDRGRDGHPGPILRTRRFFREVVAELRKVIYPSRTELATYVTVVLVFVSAMVAIVAGLDYAFTRLVLSIF